MPSSQDNDSSVFEEDESFKALMQMQRQFIAQIKREQELELELQVSTARSLGSVATVNELVSSPTPFDTEAKPEPTRAFPKEESKKPPAEISPEEKNERKRPAEFSPDDDNEKKRRRLRSSRTFSKFDFDEIYFSVFEPEKQDDDKSNADQQANLAPTPIRVRRQEKEEERAEKAKDAVDSIFRQEGQNTNGTLGTPTPDSGLNLVSIVTDDDYSEDGHSEDDRSHEERPRSRSSSLDPLDDWKPSEKCHESADKEDSNTLCASNDTEASTLLHAMQESTESYEELLDWNDEMNLKECFIAAMSKTSESRNKIRELLQQISLTASA